MSDPRFMPKAVAGKPEGWTSDQWSTPWPVVHDLEREFGSFDLDPCCMEATAKAPVFYTPREDGLSREWRGRVFMNPPYSKPVPWLEKAIAETTEGRADLVVALIPVSTDTRWFHRLVKDHAELRFIQGRVRFIGWQGTPIQAPKAPSMFAIYRRPCDFCDRSVPLGCHSAVVASACTKIERARMGEPDGR